MKNKQFRLFPSTIAAFISLAFTGPSAFAADTDGTWSADASGNWSDAANWTSSTVGDGVGFTATLGDFITADRIITLDSARSIGNITTLDATHNFTISGANILTLDVASGSPTINTFQDRTLTIDSVIAGDEGLTKTSSGTTTGTLILGGDNTYTGDTIVNAGTLAVTHNNALGSTTGKTIINGGNTTTGFTLSLSSATTDLTIPENLDFNANAVGRANLTNSSAQNHTLSGTIIATGISPNFTQFSSSGTGSITISGDITSGVGNNVALFVRGTSTSAANQLTGSVNITGGGFTKTDPGTWLVGAPGKTYSWGATSVTNGTLKMGKADLLPPATLLTVGQTANNSATFDLNGFNQTVAGIVNGAGNGTKTITSATAAVLTLNNSTNSAPPGSATNIFLLSGSLGLKKQGTGSLTLPGANTYTGATTLEGGTLALGNTTPLGTTPGTDGTSAISMASGTALQSNTSGANPSTTIAAPITLSGVGDVTFRIGQGAGSNVHSFNLNGAIGGTTGNVVYSTTTNSFSNGSSTFVLGSAGTYTGRTIISTGNGGNNPVFLRAGSGVVNALPASTVLEFDGTSGGGTGRTYQYDLAGNDQTLAGLTNTVASLRRVIVTSTIAATLTINNTTDFSFGGSDLTVTAGPVNTINRAQITGAIALTKSGAGTFTLGGLLVGGATEGGNTFTGSTKVLGGILSLGETTSLRNSAFDTANSITGTSTGGLRSTVTTLTLGGLTGGNDFSTRFTTTTGGYTGLTALTLNPGTGVTHSYSANIGNGNGSMSLTKTGAGTQILTSTNTYTGDTTISGGALTLGANDALPATPISIGSATLDAATFDDTFGTLDAAGTAVINLGAGANLVFANSSGIDWTGGTLNITGTFVSGSSIRFGSSAGGLLVGQLALISVNSAGAGTYTLNSSGFLIAPGGSSNYASWANDPLKGNIPGEPATGDFDNDGITNIVEYALGKNPRVSSQPAGVLSGNVITYTKGTDAIANGDVSWVIETSQTLAAGSWTPQVTQPAADPALTISYTLTPSTPVKNFARLKVTQP